MSPQTPRLQPSSHSQKKKPIHTPLNAHAMQIPPHIHLSILPKGGYLNLLPTFPSPLATLLTHSQSHGTSLPKTSYPAILLNRPLSGLTSRSATRVVSRTSVAWGSTIWVRYMGSRGEGHEDGLREGGGGAGLRFFPGPWIFR